MPRIHRIVPSSLFIFVAAVAAIPAAEATNRWVGTPPYLTIQSAIDASASGDTVLVPSGTYPESLTVAGKDIAIVGQPADDVPVLVYPNPAARTVTIGAGVTTLALANIQFTDGRAPRGAFALVPSGVTLVMDYCVLSGNHAHEAGGNSQGGALYFSGGSTGDIELCSFLSNQALAPFDETGNASGGAIYCAAGSHLEVRATSFDQNIAQGFEGGPGGAIALNEADAEFDGCVFSQNAGMEGGAIHAVGGDLSVLESHFISNNVAFGPSALSWFGGGTLTLRGNVFRDNWGNFGGTVYARGVLPCEISNNTVAFNQGSPAGIEIDGPFALSHNIVAFNQGSGIECHGTGTLDCNDVWNNAAGNYGAECTDPTGTDGNISLDPLFCDGANRDLRLQSTSPCAPDAGACGLIGALGVGCQPPNGVGNPTLPNVAFLAPVSPNPPHGTIRFRIDVARSARLKLVIVDATGRSLATVADEVFEPGRHEPAWSGAGMRPGVYWALLQGPGVRQSRRFVIVR